MAVLVGGVREVVVGFGEAEFEGEGVGDAHAVFAIEHEGDGAGDVGIEGEGDEIEHVAVVLGGLAFGGGVEIEMGVVLFFERDIDPLFGGDEAGFDLVEEVRY